MCDRCKEQVATDFFAWIGDSFKGEDKPIAGWCESCSDHIAEEDAMGLRACSFYPLNYQE